MAATAAATCTEALASVGCSQVNSGTWNVSLQSFSIGATLSSFDNGDRIIIRVSGSGHLALLGSSGGSFLGVLFIDSPGSGTYTIAPPYTTFRILNDAIAGPLHVTATCTPAPAPSPQPPQPAPPDHSQATKSFLFSRINGILLVDPGSTSLLNRVMDQGSARATGNLGGPTNIVGNAAASGGAMALGAPLGSRAGQVDADRPGIAGSVPGDEDAGGAGSRSFQFSGSLSRMRREAAQAQMEAERMALGAADRGAPPLGYAPSPWDLWVEGRYSAFNDDTGQLDRSGHVGAFYVGTDYRIARSMIVGTLLQLDWSKDDSGVVASRVEGRGWMVGPYLAMRLGENVYFDLRAAWGRASNELALGAATGQFETARWLVKGALAGNWYSRAWRITPSVQLAYVSETQEAFTDTVGTLVPAHKIALGRLQFGPEVGYRIMRTPNLLVEPFAAIRGVWDFDNPNVAIVDGLVIGPGDFWGRLEGGLTLLTSRGTYVRGSATWDGVGRSDWSSYTLQGTVNVPLN